MPRPGLKASAPATLQPYNSGCDRALPSPVLPIPQVSHQVLAWFHSQDVIMGSNVIEKRGIVSLSVRSEQFHEVLRALLSVELQEVFGRCCCFLFAPRAEQVANL